MKTDSIVEKLKRLISLEKSAREIGSLHEAENAAARIQAMLTKHKLSMSEIEWEQREEDEDIDKEYIVEGDEGFIYSKSRQRWQVNLGCAIATANGCKMLVVLRRGNSVCFVGRESDRELCKVLFIHLLKVAHALNDRCADEDTGQQKFKYITSLRPWQDYDLGAFRRWMKNYKATWFMGFSNTVSARLYQQHRESVAASQNSMALVHIKKDEAAIEVFLGADISHRKNYSKKMGMGRKPKFRNFDGYLRGKQAGVSVSLEPGAPEVNQRLIA